MLSFRFRRALITCISMLFLVSTSGYSHAPNAYAKESKFLVAQPVLSLYEECSVKSSYTSQAIYGHMVSVVEDRGGGWALIETEDNYRGFALLSGLVPDDPRWRTSRKGCRVASIGGMVYTIEDTELPALMRLSFGSRIETVEDFDSNTNRWVEVRLVDGRCAWMQRGDLEKPTTRSLDEMIQLSNMFLELPYIWGGTSSEGFDCSGYTQMLCKQMGILLPKDSQPQSECDKLTVLEYPEYLGDLVFFGEGEVTHVGIYLDDGKFIHAGVRNNRPKVTIITLEQTEYNFLAAGRLPEVAFQATVSHITPEVKSKMTHSWRSDNPVPLEELRYIQMNHWGFDGCVHDGEMIVHESVADEVVEIFEELFAKQYPIEKMLLIDAYKAADDLSCEDNNTSAFCSRPITGSTTKWSLHSYGRAIDINPLLNPYHKGDVVVPINGREFLDRSIDCIGVIDEDDPCYQAFISRGWKWGGHGSHVDYQHFQK